MVSFEVSEVSVQGISSPSSVMDFAVRSVESPKIEAKSGFLQKVYTVLV